MADAANGASVHTIDRSTLKEAAASDAALSLGRAVAAAETGAPDVVATAKARIDELVKQRLIKREEVPLGRARPEWYESTLRHAALRHDGSYITYEMIAKDGKPLDVIAHQRGGPLRFPINAQEWGLDDAESSWAVMAPSGDGNIIVILGEAGRPTASRESLTKQLG
jgi:hypothetical protein